MNESAISSLALGAEESESFGGRKVSHRHRPRSRHHRSRPIEASASAHVSRPNSPPFQSSHPGTIPPPQRSYTHAVSSKDQVYPPQTP